MQIRDSLSRPSRKQTGAKKRGQQPAHIHNNSTCTDCSVQIEAFILTIRNGSALLMKACPRVLLLLCLSLVVESISFVAVAPANTNQYYTRWVIPSCCLQVRDISTRVRSRTAMTTQEDSEAYEGGDYKVFVGRSAPLSYLQILFRCCCRHLCCPGFKIVRTAGCIRMVSPSRSKRTSWCCARRLQSNRNLRTSVGKPLASTRKSATDPHASCVHAQCHGCRGGVCFQGHGSVQKRPCRGVDRGL